MKYLIKISKNNNHYICFVIQILLDIEDLLKTQVSLVDVPIPDDSKFTVIGDIHGQFYDLMNIFKLNGLPSPTNPYVKYL